MQLGNAGGRSLPAAPQSADRRVLSADCTRNRYWAVVDCNTSNLILNRLCRRLVRKLKKILFVLDEFVQTMAQRILSAPGNRLTPADRPWRSAGTIRGAAATRCWEKSAYRRPEFQDIKPLDTLPFYCQFLRPELIQLRNIPKSAGEPATSPLPRPMQGEITKADQHGFTGQLGLHDLPERGRVMWGGHDCRPNVDGLCTNRPFGSRLSHRGRALAIG